MSEPTRLTMLGCGGSLGVPNIAGRWGQCDPTNPKNRRMRTSAWVEYQGKKFLIDTSPDLRTQIIQNDLLGQRPDAVFYTHAHADHVHGIDELRAYFWAHDQQKVPIYLSQEMYDKVSQHFSYLFKGSGETGLYKAALAPHIISEGYQSLAGATITIVEQDHGDVMSLGYRFGNIGYSTDFKRFTRNGLELLKGIKIWAVSVADWNSTHPSHAIMSEVLAWIDIIQPEQVFLIHLNPNSDYDTLCRQLPLHIRPAYDGLVLEA